jgi:hypothetical protein
LLFCAHQETRKNQGPCKNRATKIQYGHFLMFFNSKRQPRTHCWVILKCIKKQTFFC